jgi:hypothetical protein
MEKAILKTLIYAHIFDYPLKAREIHKWLVGKKTTLDKVEKSLNKLVQKGKCELGNGYYFLPKRADLVMKRKRKEKQSVKYLQKAKIIANLIRIIPWIKLVGISGGLALMNSSKKDDIDFFIITATRRLWLTRLFCLLTLSIVGQRRKASDGLKDTAGKICLNTVLDEENIEQQFKDFYTSHEVLQMKPLWQKDGCYSYLLKMNEWAFIFLPNWTTQIKYQRIMQSRNNPFLDLGEQLAKYIQLKIMRKPQGLERISDGALYFYPKDYRLKVLSEYQRKIKKIISP